MSKTIGYEVLVDELTVHRTVSELKNPLTGDVTGYVAGLGEIHFLGEVLSPEQVGYDIRAALEDEDNPLHDSVSKKLKIVSDEPSQNEKLRLGVPFDGYDDMSEEAILAAMVNLPSPAQQRIKEYEAGKENRDNIVNYNIGYGESPVDRQLGKVGSQTDEAARDEASKEKASAKLTTREVPDTGLVTPGEGVTGTGDPTIPHGSKKKAAAEGEESTGLAKARKGRRPRKDEDDSDKS